MNKQELISKMASTAGLTKADAKRALDAFMTVTTDALKKGEKVILIGYGTFSVVERKARKGVNPKTKKAIKIPAKKVVKFKAGAGLSLK